MPFLPQGKLYGDYYLPIIALLQEFADRIL